MTTEQEVQEQEIAHYSDFYNDGVEMGSDNVGKVRPWNALAGVIRSLRDPASTVEDVSAEDVEWAKCIMAYVNGFRAGQLSWTPYVYAGVASEGEVAL